ncbi:NAD(P)-binding protein [Mycena sp. CBHHK59/15]|nr:NAD(P)-binding protein [Mycena sp. CBHHK59/15]
MTITQAPSAPLVAVVGATGRQGGSVVRALAESDKPYRIRGFTRDATKPAAKELVKLGVEIVVISLVVENKENVYQAFAGADAAFASPFFEHFDADREIAEGKLLIDAAKASGATRVVWSGCEPASQISGGKYVHLYHWDSKALVTQYGRASGIPFVEVQVAHYAQNGPAPRMTLRPSKQDDGSFLVCWPMKPTTVIPVIDVAHDYGLFVRQVLEAPVFPNGSTVAAYGEKIALGDMVAQFAEITGKKCVFQQISIEEFQKKVGAFVPPHFVLAMADVSQYLEEYGHMAGHTSTSPELLARRPRTWAEFAKVQDWSPLFA